MSGSEWLVMTAGDAAIVYRPGDNRTWRARAQGDGWLILPDMFGSLPPANEAGADPIEVALAEQIAAAGGALGTFCQEHPATCDGTDESCCCADTHRTEDEPCQ